MKSFKAVVLAGALLGLGAATGRADHTNVVQTMNIQLLALKQGATTRSGIFVFTAVDTTQVNTRRVIEELGVATLNSFSSTSKLVVVTPVGGGDSSVQVRDGSNPPVDVTSFFTHQESDGVATSLLNTRTGRSASTSFNIHRFTLQDGMAPLNLHFDVNGIGSTDSTSTLPGVGDLNVDVTGSGDRNGNLLILQGSIGVRGRTLEVVADEPPPGV